MIYLIAVILSLAACVMSFASEVTTGNVGHIENGRPPNAGAAIFPMIPILPLLAVSVAWFLQSLVPAHAISILGGAFLLFLCLWAVSFVRLRVRFQRLLTSQPHPKQP